MMCSHISSEPACDYVYQSIPKVHVPNYVTIDLIAIQQFRVLYCSAGVNNRCVYMYAESVHSHSVQVLLMSSGGYM